MTLTYITIGAFVIVLGVLIISPKFRKQNYLLKVIKENYIPLNKFIYFLKINNIYESYIYNLKKDNITYPNNLLDLYKYTDEAYFVAKGFIWRNTKEGYEYWEIINNEWISKKNKIEYNKEVLNFLIKNM